MTLETLNYKVY